MRKFKTWIVDDWYNHRFRLILETVGTILIVSGVTYLAINGESAHPAILLSVNVIAGTCWAIVSYFRKSVNFLTTNIVCVIIGIVGLLRLID